jgi:uncharacterized membrane protein YkgB
MIIPSYEEVKKYVQTQGEDFEPVMTDNPYLNFMMEVAIQELYFPGEDDNYTLEDWRKEESDFVREVEAVGKENLYPMEEIFPNT